MKAKFEIDGDVLELNSNEYDEITEFLYHVKKKCFEIESEISLSEEDYKYDYGINE